MPDSLIDQALALEGITGKAADFAKSIYHQESSSGGNTTTSNRGAVGGMQIIPSTFKSVADKGWDITNPLQNVRAGIRYANKMFNAANEDPAIAAAGYYGGTGGLLKAKKGIAVSDPKNPNAPTTLEYGSQVAGRMNPQPSAYLNDFMSRLKSTVAENKQKKIDEENAKVASGDDINSFMQTIKLASQPDQPQAQPDTLIGDLKQGVSKLGSAIWNNGNPITGALKTAYGIGEAGVGGLAGMGGKAVEGLYGTASGLTGMLPKSLGGGGGFEQGYNQGAQQIQSLTQHIPQPVTNAGQAVAQIMGAPSAEFARGGQALGQSVENLTGSKTAGGLAASGLETLGNAVAMGLPLKGRIAPEVVAGEQARQFAANRPVQEVPQVTQPIQAAERPAQQAPLAINASDLAAQAETMQRPTETPIAATADQTATIAPTVAESAPVAAIEAPKTVVTTVAPELLDIQRSKPVEGGVNPELQQARHDVLRNIGLNEGELRAGVVSGDSRLLGQERELAKADTEAGQAMQKQHDLEQQKLTEYGDNIVRDTGGTFGAEAVHRGSTIFNALDQYAKEFKSSINQAYKDAGDRVGTAGIDISNFMTTLKDPANFKGSDGLSVRKDVMNTLRQRDLINPDGTLKPINAAQAEQIRQSINESWDGMKPQTQRAVGTLVNSLDEAVTKNLGKDEYAAARAKRKQYAEIFENPKGIAKILEVNGKDGINHAISYEKLGDKMRQLAETDVAQFEHIKQTLANMPNANLQALADKALGEIRAQIAERITSAKTPAAIERAYAPYKGSKIRQIFGDELANKLDNYVAAVGVLRGVDKNPSGTASMGRNLIDKATRGGAVAVGTTVGGVLSGGIGLAVGGLLGEAFAGRIKSHMLEAIDAKTLDKSLSPKQFEVMQKVYESKLKALGAVPEMKQAKQLLNSGKDVSPKQLSSLSKRIEKTKQWADFAKLLTLDQRKSIKNLGVIAWLSQTGQDKEAK